jgi:hypothetical protein
MAPAAVCALAGTLLAPAAHAQGPGVRAGDLLIHPRAQVGVGYDDNIFLESEDDPNAPVNSSSVLKVGGGLSLANRSPNKVALTLDTEFRFQEYLSPDTSSATAAQKSATEKSISERDGIEYGRGELAVALLPRSPVTVEAHEDMRFTDRASFQTAEGTSVPEGLFQRLENAVGADVRFHPGDNPDSRPFEMRLGYRLHTIGFLGDETAVNRRAELTAHEGTFLTSWKFLPKTALEAEFDLAHNDYNQVPLDTRNASSPSPDRDSTPFRAVLGLRGLVTNHISVVLRAGYGNTFNASGDSFSGPIGEAGLEYALEPSLSAGITYQHNGRDSSFSNFVTVDRVAANAELIIASRWRLAGTVGYQHYDYSTSNVPLEGGHRIDPVYVADALLGYKMREWLELEATWNFEKDASDYELPGNPTPNEKPEFFAYTRNVVLVSVKTDY